jgi:flagellar hook assembly protein FlgD
MVTVVPETVIVSKNVFVPGTAPLVIDYQPSTAGFVRVKILNVAGETVVTLLEATQNATPQRVSWDGRNKNGNIVGSGLYFVWIDEPGRKKFLKVIVRR